MTHNSVKTETDLRAVSCLQVTCEKFPGAWADISPARAAEPKPARSTGGGWQLASLKNSHVPFLWSYIKCHSDPQVGQGTTQDSQSAAAFHRQVAQHRRWPLTTARRLQILGAATLHHHGCTDQAS